jgi:hypothetical protein
LLAQAFDDCTTLSSTFKLLESFEGLLERDAIAAEVAKKHKDMVAAFANDVKEVHELFLANRAFPVLSKNSPPHSGAAGPQGCSCAYAAAAVLIMQYSWLRIIILHAIAMALLPCCLCTLHLQLEHVNNKTILSVYMLTVLACFCRCCILGAWPNGAPAGAHGQATVNGGSAAAAVF